MFAPCIAGRAGIRFERSFQAKEICVLLTTSRCVGHLLQNWRDVNMYSPDACWPTLNRVGTVEAFARAACSRGDEPQKEQRRDAETSQAMPGMNMHSAALSREREDAFVRVLRRQREQTHPLRDAGGQRRPGQRRGWACRALGGREACPRPARLNSPRLVSPSRRRPRTPITLFSPHLQSTQLAPLSFCPPLHPLRAPLPFSSSPPRPSSTKPLPPLPFFSPRAPPPRPLPSLLLRPPGSSLQLAAMASGIPVRTTSSVDGLELGGSSDGLALPPFPCRPPARPGPAQASPLALVCLACAAASNPCPRLARPFSARELLTYFPPPSCASPPPPLLPLPLRFPSPYISSHIRSHRPDE